MTTKLYVRRNEWTDLYNAVLIGITDDIEGTEVKLIKNEMIKGEFIKIYNIKVGDDKRILKRIEEHKIGDNNGGFYSRFVIEILDEIIGFNP